MQLIICGFFDLIGNFLNSILPNMSNTGFDSVSTALTYFINFISASNYLIPVSTLFQITGIVVAYRLYLFGVWVANWVIHVVRG